jgi:hypothetical protein
MKARENIANKFKDFSIHQPLLFMAEQTYTGCFKKSFTTLKAYIHLF